MRYLGAMGLAVVLVAANRGAGGEPSCRCAERDCALKRVAPAGGWHPDCGGLLNWWRPDCFPRCGGPDDYCRKPAPCVCRPAYPPFYSWAASESCYARPCCQPANAVRP